MKPKVAILVTHPIQYFSPWFRELAKRDEVDCEVLYGFHPSAEQQGAAYGVSYEWDVPLLEGYKHRFLKNVSQRPGFDFAGIDTPEVTELVRSRTYDAWIICGWNVKSYWQAIRACHRNRIPMAVRGDSHLLGKRSLPVRMMKRFLHGRWIPRFSACLAVGKLNEEYYLHYGARREQIFPVRHFVDNEWFGRQADEARASRAELRRKWNIADDATVFLFCGRVIDLKRPIELLRAFKAAQTVGKSAHLLVVGEGPLRGACEELARAEKLPVTFTGFMNQGKLPEAYAASDVLVLCSMETWGLVVNEAMAAGLPAILSDQVGCAPDLVPSGETGMVYPHGDDEALARCMKTYLEKPVLARLHGDKARELVTTRYNVCGAADRTIEALLRII